MYLIKCTALRYFFAKYTSDPGLRSLEDRVKGLALTKNKKESIDESIEIYKEAIPLIKKEVWKNVPDQAIVARYQEVFREMEKLISIKGEDERHEFIIVVPVADRPQQLSSCLNSLLDLCKSYNYGGYSNNKYGKVSVLIADDSKEKENRIKNKKISSNMNSQGVDVVYFGLDDQLRAIDFLEGSERDRLSRVIGNETRSAFYHKGPSIMRNIAYLKLNDVAKDVKKPLFYFVDSDQEFKVEVNTDKVDIDLLAINYFYELDRVFTQTEANILTGKVVGDPPVSPSVMAGNFLEDVISFMRQIAEKNHEASCQFHHSERRIEDDAAYHDMADLFGFTLAKESYHYNCPLEGVHNNAECFKKFAVKLNRFFYGEHPTRKTYFSYEDVVDYLKPARTVYTGNYIFKPQALKYFVPFATLKLRMAGPVLGRIVKSEMKGRFVSANLPMLHKRTVQETGQSEFRPGVTNKNNDIDLSGEFERQFFGDVMLFAIERLADMGYPSRAFPRESVETMVNSIEEKMYEQYKEKHREIVAKQKVLSSIVGNKENWWNKLCGLEMAKENIELFVRNIESNFGVNAKGYELISSEYNKKKRKREIVEAIMTYSDDRQAWEEALSNIRLSA